MSSHFHYSPDTKTSRLKPFNISAGLSWKDFIIDYSCLGNDLTQSFGCHLKADSLLSALFQWSWNSTWTSMWTNATQAWWRLWGTASGRAWSEPEYMAGTPPRLLSLASLMPMSSSTLAGKKRSCLTREGLSCFSPLSHLCLWALLFIFSVQRGVMWDDYALDVQLVRPKHFHTPIPTDTAHFNNVTLVISAGFVVNKLFPPASPVLSCE